MSALSSRPKAAWARFAASSGIFFFLRFACAYSTRFSVSAANLAQAAFGRDDNALTLFDDAGEHVLDRAPKIVLARRLVAHIARML